MSITRTGSQVTPACRVACSESSAYNDVPADAAKPIWFRGSPYTHRVAADVMRYGPISRIELARQLHLTQGAVSRMVSDLVHLGVVCETKVPSGAGKKGRPQRPLAIRRRSRSFVGVNLRGDAAMATGLNATCQPVGRAHEADLKDRTPACVVETLNRVIRTCREDIRKAGLPEPVLTGVSLGGKVVEGRLVTYAPFLGWEEEVDLPALLAAVCPVPCRVFNDLEALATYEVWFGSGVGLDRFAMITVGAGVGYSLAEKGMTVPSPDQGLGLIGHLPLDPLGPVCHLGHKGCSQCLTSGSLAEQYSQIIGATVPFDRFVADVEARIPQALSLLNLTAFRLGVLVSAVADLALPDKVVVGGETSYLMKMGIEAMRQGISSHRHSQMTPIPVEVLNDDWEHWARAAGAHVIADYLLDTPADGSPSSLTASKRTA